MDGHVTAQKSLSLGFRLHGERGYMLLTLALMVSLLVVAAAAVAPSIARQIRRDQETELIRRGMQYRRAIRQFTKKTGRFPLTIEDLENTNGVRYLRRRYKDPVTGKEFRLLHMGDIPAAIGTSSNAWSLQPSASANGAGDGSASESGQDSSGIADAQNPQSSAADKPTVRPQLVVSATSSASNGFGGGVIVGVASTSKKKAIREFDRRDRYNQWLFFYDPGFERPFEVQGPTPLTHPPVALQNAPNSSNAAQSSSSNAPNSSSQSTQSSPPQP
jgi:type II secretory pathway pseudopilin PulG